MEQLIKRRKSKSATIYIPVGALAIILLTILGVSSFMRIMVIEVDGITRYAPDDIILASGISKGDNLLFLDTDAIEQRIILAMPFIDSVTISRVMPDGILIEVEDSAPVAMLEMPDRVLILDVAARVLEISDVRVSGLVEIRGIAPIETDEGRPLRVATGDGRQAQYLREILSLFEREDMFGDVSYLDMSNMSQISFGYTDRFRVLLGGPTSLSQKITMLRNPATIARIDMEAGEGVPGEINMTNPAAVIFNRSP
ncbi:MAG: FtsQ-type POTRA domain-containing protein [Oscillospiraceae bacterium]|nr:FtsQ-type POTRA domain-containing protein [Oscillospiraceae bacterium]